MGSLTTTPRQSKRRAYSPHMVGYWPMTNQTFQDFSGNGLDMSITNAPRWEANKAYRANVIVLPTVPNGRFYWCSAAGTSGAVDVTGSWTTTASAIQLDGPNTLAWTCEPYIDYFGVNAYATFPAGKTSQVYSACRTPWQMVDYLCPPQDGNIVYNSSTISAATSDRSINDTAGTGFGAFTAGDWVLIGDGIAGRGFTGDTINNAITRITTKPSNTKLTFTAPQAIATVDNLGEPVWVRKVLPPASLVFSCFLISANTVGAFFPFQFLESASVFHGFYSQIGATRVIGYASSNWVPTLSTLSGSASPTTTATRHWTVVVDREVGTITFYKDGVLDAGPTTLNKQQQASLVQTLANGPAFFIGGASSMNGATKMWGLQMYIGRNLPAGLTTGSPPPLVAQLYNSGNGGTLSPTDWP